MLQIKFTHIMTNYRMIKLKEKPNSLAFCSSKADLLVGIGNHVFRISHQAC